MITLETEIPYMREVVAEGADLYLDDEGFCVGLFSVEDQAYLISPEATVAQMMIALLLFEHKDLFPVIHHPTRQQFKAACRHIM